jgi:hypothetical protein
LPSGAGGATMAVTRPKLESAMLTPRLCLALLACAVLVGCGADGAPEPPLTPGITVSGEARIGVVGE